MTGESQRDIQFEQARDQWLEKLRHRYRKDRNPLRAWQAVTICNLANHPPRPLPQWCMDYVVTVAVGLRALGNLNDPETYPFDTDGLTQDQINDRISEWQRRKITPADAIAILPRALELTRPGWNAFARCAAESEAELLSIGYDFARRVSTSKFIAREARERNIQPDAVKRRISRGRRVAKPAPLPPDRTPSE